MRTAPQHRTPRRTAAVAAAAALAASTALVSGPATAVPAAQPLATAPAAVSAAAAPAVAAAPAAAAARRPRCRAHHDVSFGQITKRVTYRVLARYPNAYLVEADGASPSGPTRNVRKVTRWRYVFNDLVDFPQNRTIFATVTLPCTGRISITFDDDVYVGSDPLRPPYPMGVDRAGKILRAAGITKPFRFITYREPNASGPTPNPLFIFGPFRGGVYYGVDSRTGRVVRLLS